MVGTVRATTLRAYRIDDVTAKLALYKHPQKDSRNSMGVVGLRSEKDKSLFQNDNLFNVLFSFDGDALTISKKGLAESQRNMNESQKNINASQLNMNESQKGLNETQKNQKNQKNQFDKMNKIEKADSTQLPKNEEIKTRNTPSQPLANLKQLTRYELDRLVSENKIPMSSYLIELESRKTDEQKQQQEQIQ